MNLGEREVVMRWPPNLNKTCADQALRRRRTKARPAKPAPKSASDVGSGTASTSEETLIAGKVPLARPKCVLKLVLPIERFWTPPVSVTVEKEPAGGASGVSPSDVNLTVSEGLKQ